MAKTYKPKKIIRKRTHGFFARKATASGRNVMTRRRRKGRKRIVV
ncbi:MAG: 50S ribosomal protein L34 [bacterium]|nr:50S ribosomal protein L34 [bacterium]MDZ4296180.1 50S ribosomal protein L34 [Patescibacteria group bacterium]